MQFTISTTKLLSAVKAVLPIVDKRGTIPVLANLKIEVKNGQLVQITASDMDSEITIKLDVESSSAGITTVPAHKLSEILSNLERDSNVDIKLGDGGVSLRSGRRRFKLPTLPHEDFPSLTYNKQMVSFTIFSEELAKFITKTLPFTSDEQTRYYLQGVYMHIDKGDLHWVATNGHALSVVSRPSPESDGELPGVILPQTACESILRVFKGTDVVFSVSDGGIKIEGPHACLVSKVIDGSFPDYHRVIPQCNDKIFTAERDILRTAVQVASCIQDDKTSAIRIAISGSSAAVSSTQTDQSSAIDSIDIEYDGPDIEFGINSRYLQQVLGNIDHETVQVFVSDAMSPIVIHGINDKSSTFVVMPMRV